MRTGKEKEDDSPNLPKQSMTIRNDFCGYKRIHTNTSTQINTHPHSTHKRTSAFYRIISCYENIRSLVWFGRFSVFVCLSSSFSSPSLGFILLKVFLFVPLVYNLVSHLVIRSSAHTVQCTVYTHQYNQLQNIPYHTTIKMNGQGLIKKTHIKRKREIEWRYTVSKGKE